MFVVPVPGISADAVTVLASLLFLIFHVLQASLYYFRPPYDCCYFFLHPAVAMCTFLGVPAVAGILAVARIPTDAGHLCCL